MAGQDYSAMWSLVLGNITEDHVDLEPGLGNRYRSIAVIAVSISGVEDILHIRIPHHLGLGCSKALEAESHSSYFWSGLEPWQLVAVISLSVLVSVLFVIMLLVICCGRKKAPTMKHLEQKGRQSNSSSVNGSSEKFNKSVQSTILGNTYVPLPYSFSTSSSISSIEYSDYS